jgi:ribosomal silencing factor RsfS
MRLLINTALSTSIQQHHRLGGRDVRWLGSADGENGGTTTPAECTALKPHAHGCSPTHTDACSKSAADAQRPCCILNHEHRTMALSRGTRCSGAELARRVFARAWRAATPPRASRAGLAALSAAPSRHILCTALRAWWKPGAGRRPLSLPAVGVQVEGGGGGPPAHQPPADPAKEADMREVLELLDEKKAMDVVVLRADEIERMRVLCDYMVILTCTSRRHMKIVADHVVDHFRLKGMLVEVEDDTGKVVQVPPSVEDADSEEWMLVDLGHVIVQILTREGRDKVCRCPLRPPLVCIMHNPDRVRLCYVVWYVRLCVCARARAVSIRGALALALGQGLGA